jgi:uncharacterized protein (DUF952 family)
VGETIYKVCSESEWRDAERLGTYRGSADDLRDGFIHLSRAHQLEVTLAKYFAGRADLVLVALDADTLGDALCFEPSRGGDLFPHLYAELPPARARWVHPLVWDGARHDLTLLGAPPAAR